MKKVFLLMSLLGIVLPYYFLINYLQEDDASWIGFWSDLYLTNPMSMVTMDITVAASSFLILIAYQYAKKQIALSSLVKYIACFIMVGFSLALPIYLYDNFDKITNLDS